MLNTMVSNFCRFEDDLAEKRPYKHRGKIMHFLIGLYCNFINATLCRVFADRVTIVGIKVIATASAVLRVFK